MGCGASAEPYQPESASQAPPAAVADAPPAAVVPEAQAEAPAEVQVGDGSGAGIMVAAAQPEGEGDEDGPQFRGPCLPFVRFDKSAIPKDVSNGQEVYLQFGSGNFLGGSAEKMDAESAEMAGAQLFAVERQSGVGPIKDGDGVLLKHSETGLYVEALSDQYPVRLAPRNPDAVAQIFSMFKLGNPLTVRHNDTVYLQSWLSNYVESAATITGEPCIVARRWRRSDNASMTILKKEVVEATTTELARKMQFQSFDMDGNGSIGRAEMEFLLKKVKGELAEGELDQVMSNANEDGGIEYNNFVSWAEAGGLSEDQLQHAEVLGNTAQRCNDALKEESALIEILTTAHMNQCTAMKAEYATRFPNEDGSPGDLPADIEKKATEQDGWIFSNNWKLAMRALMEDEVQIWTRSLNDAMKGWGTDEDSLTYLICTMPERLRPQIFEMYNFRFGKGLLEHVESETSGSYKKVLCMQAMAPEDCKAQLLYESMKGIGTNEDQLIRVICGCDIPERGQIKEAFLKRYSRQLLDWVQSETSGDFKKALTCLLEAEESEFDLEADCAAMKAAMDGWGTDEAALIKLICSKTSRQMEMVNEKFEELYGKQLFTRVKAETSGHFQATLLGCIRHPMKQLAHTVRDCMKGWGTAELGLLTSLVHLPDFKKAALIKQYRQEFEGRDLIADIKSDCSGNYEKALLALVRPAPRVWAEAITAAMKGLGTSDQLLINFMCIAKDEMGEVRKAFKMLNGKSLLQWVEGDCSGDYKKTLAALANRNTEDDPTMKPVYWAQRARDAVRDVDCLQTILTSLPSIAIKRGMEVYQAVYGRSLKEEISTKCSEGGSWFQWTNWYKTAMLRLCSMPVELYVDGLHDAMDGIGTDETTLTALVCTIPENMYGDIHKLYAEKYGKSLLALIESETSFGYKKAMLYQAADWPESRAMALRGALAGLGTSEDQLTRVVICSTMKERKRIQEAYEKLYKKGLSAHIDEDTSGSFQAILCATLESCDPVPDGDIDFEDDCNKLKEAMDGIGTDEDALVRVIAGKTPEQIVMLRSKFMEMFDFDLYDRIDDETWDWGACMFTGSNFRNCILGLLRPPIENLACCVRDCIVGFGTDDTGLVTCLVHLSERRRKELVTAYMRIKNGGDLFGHITGDTTGCFEGALLGMVNPAPATWAKAMKSAMKGLGTSDNLLISMLCVSKDRMDEVRDAFREANGGQELSDWIAGDCSGDYKDLLVKLANREVYKYPGSDAMVQVPPPPSKEIAQYEFSKTFNRLCRAKKADSGNELVPTETDLQEMANVFMYYGQKSSCAPNMDKQGVWDLTNAVGFPPADDGDDLVATFNEWDVSGTGEITWNDFAREMMTRVNDPNHYEAEPLAEIPPLYSMTA